ncbi:hypothetical protein J6590_103966 [Homalodisca vitripennis]|nr:hypothetical protein J6590_103966 [Homalodisca vitripennis]
MLRRAFRLLPKVDTTGLACCLLAFLLYYNTLYADFIYIDSYANVPGHVSGSVHNVASGLPTSAQGGYYRPRLLSPCVPSVLQHSRC